MPAAAAWQKGKRPPLSVSPWVRPALRASPWLILVVLVMGLFMILLDSTIVNIAIPSIMTGFNTGLLSAEWVVDAYIMSFAATMITLGRFGDIYGRRLMLLAGLADFTLFSLACGLSSTINWLIAFRVLQGLGAGAIMPSSLSLVAEVFPPEQRGTALGIWGGISGLATAVGPGLGGAIVESGSWHWIFFINVPIGIAVIFFALRIVPESRNPEAVKSLDLAGVVLITVSMFSLVFALIEGQRYGWSSRIVMGLFALFALTMPAFILREWRTLQPLIDLGLFRIRNFWSANVTGMLLTFVMMAVFFIMPVFLQDVLGFTPLKAGLTLMPMAGANMAMAPLSGRLVSRLGGRRLIMGGMLAVSFGAAWMSGLNLSLKGLNPQTGIASLIPPFLLIGAGIGFSIAPVTTVVMATSPPDRFGTASGILSTFRRLGNVLGIAVLGALLQNRLVSNITSGLEGQPQVPAEIKQQVLSLVNRGALIGVPSSLDRSLPAALAGNLKTWISDAINTTFELAALVALLGALTALFVSKRP